jgi:hypothetical protein
MYTGANYAEEANLAGRETFSLRGATFPAGMTVKKSTTRFARVSCDNSPGKSVAPYFRRRC